MPTSSQCTYFGPIEVPPSSSSSPSSSSHSSCSSSSCCCRRPHPKLNILLHTTRFALHRNRAKRHPRVTAPPAHHAEPLVRHWVGGVSLRICAHRFFFFFCPAGPVFFFLSPCPPPHQLEWPLTALAGMGLSIPLQSVTHTHTRFIVGIDGNPELLAARLSSFHEEEHRHVAVAW